jgi:hypothetical protein
MLEPGFPQNILQTTQGKTMPNLSSQSAKRRIAAT